MKISYTKIPTIMNVNKSTPDNGVKKTLFGFLSHFSRAKNVNVNVNKQPAKVAKVFSNNHNSEHRCIQQTGYVSHFGPRQEPAIFIHGSSEGKFAYYKGNTVNHKDIEGNDPYISLNATEFVARIKKDFGLDLHSNGDRNAKPLHLISCYSGGVSRDTLAAAMSIATNRQIICYGNKEPVFMRNGLKNNMDEDVYIHGEYSKKALPEVRHTPYNMIGSMRK
ncbi:hypothetical protein [Pectobacterium versatile]|uniref:hypothetical protein n=1 Tax=Pectobacterium versatile TaxID=2488639 RepID=UPI001CCAF10B|nr:hypothetical protein [Pectobacterium versatile]